MAAWHLIEIVCDAAGCTTNARVEHWSAFGAGSTMRGLLKHSGWLVAKASTASGTRYYCPEHAHLPPATGPRPLVSSEWTALYSKHQAWARESVFNDQRT